MLNDDNRTYYRYTTKQRLDKAMHTLEGILQGISADRRVNVTEIAALTEWMTKHNEFANRHPFNEIIPRLTEILHDGIIDEEEAADALWLCNKVRTDNLYFDATCADMQRLQGMIAGIAADGEITKEELIGLGEWVDEHSHLRTCWPYDELDSLLTSVLADGKIDPEEHRTLLHFCGEFAPPLGYSSPTDNTSDLSIGGICAACPEVHFTDRVFCFTGSSKSGRREKLAVEIEKLGGIFSAKLNKYVDYLIVCSNGNPCWAFACYGRKVEQVVKYRKQGLKIVLVHENDFWDAVADAS